MGRGQFFQSPDGVRDVRNREGGGEGDEVSPEARIMNEAE